MPWDAATFAKHNGHLNPAQSGHAARIANAVLKRTGDEGESIAVANKYFQKRDGGGGIIDPASGGYGITPTSETMNPMTRGMMQRYASMPAEKLQEMSAMMGGSPQGAIIGQVLAQKRAKPDNPGEATTVQSYAPGGGMSMSQARPGWAQAEQSQETTGAGAAGYLHGDTPGRADQILTTAPAGSHVIPADVIAGLGEGNSLAGAHVMDQILRTGPGGISMPRGAAGRGPPRAPTPAQQQAARGGGIEKQQPVALSHGEVVISPHQVAEWGDGDIEIGHRVLDFFITEMRKRIIKEMQKLPGPVGAKK